MNEYYEVRNRKYKLERFPNFGEGPLRAWSAADEYLVNSINTTGRAKAPKIMVLNDAFGALSIPFADCKTSVFSDSFLSEVAIKKNLQRNGLDENSFDFIAPTDEIRGKFDILIIGIPKSRSLLEFQLRKIRSNLQPKTQVFAAAMVKYTHPSLYSLFQQTLGPTLAHPAKKKARLFQIELDSETKRQQKEVPMRTYRMTSPELEVCSGPGVFSKDRLDPGSAMLQRYLPKTKDELLIGDLGCGAGVLSMVSATRCPNASFILVDESRLALFSAKTSFEKNEIDLDSITFRLSSGWSGTPANSLDMVISNPPIHQGTTLNPWMAFSLFRQTHKVLKEGGHFTFVTMRKLRCAPFLKSLFSQVKVLEENSQYRVFDCIK